MIIALIKNINFSYNSVRLLSFFPPEVNVGRSYLCFCPVVYRYFYRPNSCVKKGNSKNAGAIKKNPNKQRPIHGGS